MEKELALKVLDAKRPSLTMSGDGKHILDLDGEKHEVGDADAELLFETMFFRGKL